jgi:hypothetical protein
MALTSAVERTFTKYDRRERGVCKYCRWVLPADPWQQANNTVGDSQNEVQIKLQRRLLVGLSSPLAANLILGRAISQPGVRCGLGLEWIRGLILY